MLDEPEPTQPEPEEPEQEPWEEPEEELEVLYDTNYRPRRLGEPRTLEPEKE